MYRTIHEWCERAVECVALEGRGGLLFSTLWARLGLTKSSDEVLRSRLVCMFQRDGRKRRVAVTGDLIVASKEERLRCLGVLEFDAVAHLGLHVLEEIGRSNRTGCTLTKVIARIVEWHASTEEPGTGPRQKKAKAVGTESLALDRLCEASLVSKQLRTQLKSGEGRTRVTANILRLQRFDHAVEAGSDSWKRALLEETVSSLQQTRGDSTLLHIKTFDPSAKNCVDFNNALPFCDVWQNMRRDGALVRVQARVKAEYPDFTSGKTATCLEHAKRANKQLKHPLCFFVGQVSRSTRGARARDSRELWCVGLNARAGKSAGSEENYFVSPSPQHTVLSNFGTALEKVRAAGSGGARISVIARDLGHWNSKLIEKAIEKLGFACVVKLRRITQGRVHSYLVFTNAAYILYNKTAEAIAAVAADLAAEDAVFIDAPSAVLAVAAPTALLASFNESSRDIDTEVARLPWAINKCTIKRKECISAEWQRRAAHVAATVKRLSVVDKEALHLALMHHSNGVNSGARVDNKTWRRLISQMVDNGDIKEMTVQCGEEIISILLDAALEVNGPEMCRFATNRYERGNQERLEKESKAMRGVNNSEATGKLRIKKCRREELMPLFSAKCGDLKGDEFKLSFTPRRFGMGVRLKGAAGELRDRVEELEEEPRLTTGCDGGRRKFAKSWWRSNTRNLQKTWSVERLELFQERFADLTIDFRLQLDHVFRTTSGSRRGSRKKNESAQPNKRSIPIETGGTSIPQRNMQNVSKHALPFSNKHLAFKITSVRPAPTRTSPEAAVVAGVLITPLARHFTKILVDSHRRGCDAGLSATNWGNLIATQTLGPNSRISHNLTSAELPRASWDAAASRLLRRGWAAFADGGVTNSALVLPIENIKSSCDSEVATFYGGVDFLDNTKKARDAVCQARFLPGQEGLTTCLGESLLDFPTGGHVAYFLAMARACVAFNALKNPKPWGTWSCTRVAENQDYVDTLFSESLSWRVASWRKVVTSDYEPWTSPDCKHTHTPIRKALRRVIFMHCLYHVGTTVHAIIENRIGDRRTPDLDHLEVATLLLDLCDCGALRVDRSAPTESRYRLASRRNSLTIFDDSHTTESTDSGETVSVQKVISALQERAGPLTPRFFANHDALKNFLEQEKLDDKDFLESDSNNNNTEQNILHAKQEQAGCNSNSDDEEDDAPLAWAPFPTC